MVLVKDFSCFDWNFVYNVGGIIFQILEEFFFGEKLRDFICEFDFVNYLCSEDVVIVFEKLKDIQEIVVMCVVLGGGKLIFFWRYFKLLGYECINQDIFKLCDKCVKVVDE